MRPHRMAKVSLIVYLYLAECANDVKDCCMIMKLRSLSHVFSLCDLWSAGCQSELRLTAPSWTDAEGASAIEERNHRSRQPWHLQRPLGIPSICDDTD